MNKKYWILTLALILLLSASIHIINEAHEQEAARENARIANETKQQMEYISSLQTESERIFSQDQDVRNLLNGNTSFRAYEIIHNESFVEYIYIVGFHHKNLKYSKGFGVVGGKVYNFYINTENKNVIIEEDEAHNDFKPGSGLLVINSDAHKEGNRISLDSSIHVLTYPGVWLSVSKKWMYGFKIEGHEDLELTSEPVAGNKIQYTLEVKNTVGIENYYIGYPTTIDNIADVLSNNSSLSPNYWKDERENEIDTLTISYPIKNEYPLDYFYLWDNLGDANQTIAFDIDMTVKIPDKNAEVEDLHSWRIIIKTPPNLDTMSENDMVKLGIFSTTDYGNYYPLSTTIVKKGEWLDNRNQIESNIV
ncbi:MAG: hypothetical protein PWQ44_1433 [Methanolobus sp.]|nr:hypothetical protein [Methanolobus sp.]